jgi:hypothetical protein
MRIKSWPPLPESLNKTHDAINQANNALGTLAREYLYRSMLEARSPEADCDGSGIEIGAGAYPAQEKQEAMLAGMDPQNRQTFNALYEKTGPIRRLLNEKRPK